MSERQLNHGLAIWLSLPLPLQPHSPRTLIHSLLLQRLNHALQLADLAAPFGRLPFELCDALAALSVIGLHPLRQGHLRRADHVAVTAAVLTIALCIGVAAMG